MLFLTVVAVDLYKNSVKIQYYWELSTRLLELGVIKVIWGEYNYMVVWWYKLMYVSKKLVIVLKMWDLLHACAENCYKNSLLSSFMAVYLIKLFCNGNVVGHANHWHSQMDSTCSTNFFRLCCAAWYMYMYLQLIVCFDGTLVQKSQIMLHIFSQAYSKRSVRIKTSFSS